MKNDPTTARVVSELAEALLPRLQEAVVRELSATAHTMPRETERNADAALIALNQLRETCDRVTASMTLAEKSVGETAAEIRAELERLPHGLEPPAAQMKHGADAASETAALIRSMEAATRNWEGILKADGRAHTRELSELSAETSELLRDTRSTVTTEVREAVEREFVKYDERLERLLRENETRTEAKLARAQKFVLASTAISAILSAAILAMLLMRY